MVIGERFELEQDEELRIDVDPKGKELVMVELLSGVAEIFGTEMVIGTKYRFRHGAKFSVYTYHGCSVTVYGQNEEKLPYKSKEHQMIQYLNVHSGLEDLRTAADGDGSKNGPVVMVIGLHDVGKTTLCRLFVNYAVRQGRRPIFVDLDVSQCSISVPGTIAATLVERPASIEEGFPQNAPLAYHFGHANPSTNSALFNCIVDQMAVAVEERMAKDRNAGTSGVIINTYGEVRGESYGQLINVANAFKVDVIIVLGNARVSNALEKDEKINAKIICFDNKSSGAEERTPDQRIEEASASIKQYFYGVNNSLFPHSFDVKFADLKDRIFKIGAPTLPDSCMPLGMKAEDNQTKLVPVSLTPKDLLNHILTVSHGNSVDNLIGVNAMGFVVVTDVNTKDGKISVLSPQPKPLPPSLLILSDVKYIDR